MAQLHDNSLQDRLSVNWDERIKSAKDRGAILLVGYEGHAKGLSSLKFPLPAANFLTRRFEDYSSIDIFFRTLAIKPGEEEEAIKTMVQDRACDLTIIDVNNPQKNMREVTEFFHTALHMMMRPKEKRPHFLRRILGI